MGRLFRQALLLAALALAPALVSGAFLLKRQPPLQPGEISVAQARERGPSVLYVDARPAARFEAGHIQGALRLTPEEWDTLLPKFLDEWEPDKTIVVYCDGGGCEASREVAERIKLDLKLTSVFVMQGGYPAWQER